MLVTERALRPDSGGAGTSRGGLAQTIRLRPLGDQPLRMTVRLDKLRHPAAGLLGGQPGECGSVWLDGVPADLSGPFVLEPGQELTLMAPGGGGLGDPAARDPASIRRDIALGYVTPAAARADYAYLEAAE